MSDQNADLDAALERVIAAARAHLAAIKAAEGRIDDDDVWQAYVDLNNASFAYDELLLDNFGEVTPWDVESIDPDEADQRFGLGVGGLDGAAANFYIVEHRDQKRRSKSDRVALMAGRVSVAAITAVPTQTIRERNSPARLAPPYAASGQCPGPNSGRPLEIQMKTFQIIGAILALSVSSVAFAQDASNPTASPMAIEMMTAEDYVAMAASSDMFEIQSSKMALEMSKSEGVQTFAKHMVGDHSTTTKEIMAAAKAEKIEVPSTMMPKHSAMLEKLKGTSGDAFDASYVEAQVMAHEEAVALHTAYAKSGEDAALKAVATKAVPIVTKHLKDAQALSSKA